MQEEKLKRGLLAKARATMHEMLKISSRGDGSDDRRELAKLMMAQLIDLGFTTDKIANALNVSEFTIRRWSEGLYAPRNAQVQELIAFIENAKGYSNTRIPLVKFGSHYQFAGLFAFDYFFERIGNQKQSFVEDVFVIKGFLEFRAGEVEETKRHLIEVLDAYRDMTIHYVYPQLEGINTPAGMSAENILQSYEFEKLVEDGRIKNYPITELSDLFDIGLGYSQLGHFVLRYNDVGKARYNRKMDIFVEVPCQEYSEDQKFSSRGNGTEHVLVELPNRSVTMLWSKWEQIIKTCQQRNIVLPTNLVTKPKLLECTAKILEAIPDLVSQKKLAWRFSDYHGFQKAILPTEILLPILNKLGIHPDDVQVEIAGATTDLTSQIHTHKKTHAIVVGIDRRFGVPDPNGGMVYIDKDWKGMDAGTAYYFPPDAPHGFTVEPGGCLYFLSVQSPPIITKDGEDYRVCGPADLIKPMSSAPEKVDIS